MIPFIRSMTELMVITQSKNQGKMPNESKSLEELTKVRSKKDGYINYKHKKAVSLPEIHKTKRRRWVKSKEAVSRFFNELDYNNQIQSSYDITLLEMQNNYDKHDIA